MNMKIIVRTLLVVGVVLIVCGHFAWISSHSMNPNKIRFLQFPLIPGYVAILMGWSGWIVERLTDRLGLKE